MTKNKNQISISKGNSKMGFIPSVSLPPIITCVNCSTCAKLCYADKLCRIYPSVKNAYYNNLRILTEDRKGYFEQVYNVAHLSGFFRWHVSGDILDADYFDNMCKIARKCKKTSFLVFTKNYQVINEYLNNHRKPRNLQVIFSLPFNGAIIENPHNLPLADVILKGQDAKPHHKICGGNCSECANCGIGCWELKKGETIAFYQH